MCPPLSLVVSLLLSLVSTLVLSRTGGVLSYLNSLNTQVPSISTEEFVLPRHARCVLSRLRCNGHSLLLGSYLSRIGRIENFSAAPVDTRPRTPLISFCTVQLRTLCTVHSLATLYLFTTSGPDPGEFLGFWGSMVFRHAPIPRKGLGLQQHVTFANFYAMSSDSDNLSLCYCTDIQGLFQEIGIAYSASDWRLFIDSLNQWFVTFCGSWTPITFFQKLWTPLAW